MIVFICLFLNSCEKKVDSDPVDPPFDYEQIGIEHNEGLDFVFNYLKQKTSVNKSVLTSPDSFLSLAEQGTQSFLSDNELLENDAGRSIALGESKKPFVIYSNCLKNNLKSATLAGLWPSGMDNSVTNNQKAILSEMDDILNNVFNTKDIIDALIDLEEKIKTDCSEDEQHILLCATAIGRHSVKYWFDNLDKWTAEFSPHNKLKKAQFSWAQVGRNDVAYGVGGGISGAVIGGSVTLGVLAIPGWAAGAIGGAISGSVGNAILQLW